MSPDVDSARGLLSAAGRRTTAQRSMILDILRSQPGHLDADEVYRLAKARDRRLSLSTVYRTLALLKELGEVHEVHLAEEHHHYEARPRAEHYHLICLGCGQVVEFGSPLAEQLKREQSDATGFSISSVGVDLTGYCPACRAAGREVLPLQARPQAGPR